MEKLQTRSIRLPQGALIGPKGEPIYGWRVVSAACLGGLAVHKSINPKPRHKWTVTHEASGLMLEILGGRTKAEAESNMRAALALGFDWARDEKTTLKALRAAPGLVAKLHDIGARD